ncbi:hypothetical protein AwErysi_05570 [Erysipelotrichaceae bacterium]|nr:hypothetical protein AwErysi_05570 [Erysipelotrichaceae bacterium]
MITIRLSKSEQDYLKAIYEVHIKENKQIVSIKELVAKLEFAPPTITEMLKRLEKKNLLEYQSYKGVLLSDEGIRQARFILKSHRVWEFFLLRNLGYQPDNVHEEAEALEHAASPKMVERLYNYLGAPAFCPHGNEIPQENFWDEQVFEISIADAPLNKRLALAHVSEETAAFFGKMTEKTYRNIIVIEELIDGSKIVNLSGISFVLPAFFQKELTVYQYVKGDKV